MTVETIRGTHLPTGQGNKNAFVHIDGKLHYLDLKLDNVIDNLQHFMAEMNKQFKYTWQVTVSNRLVIKLLSSGSALYDRVLHQYLQYYINYQVTLDHFITGLDSYRTWRLTFQVLDPDELNHFLKAIEEQLAEWTTLPNLWLAPGQGWTKPSLKALFV